MKALNQIEVASWFVRVSSGGKMKICASFTRDTKQFSFFDID